MAQAEIDPVLWNDWHVVADLEGLASGQPKRTVLLGIALIVTRADADVVVRRADGGAVLAEVRYGLVWACLGEPAQAIVAIPEYDEPGRCIAPGGAFGVHTSGPRVVENFLDLGHLGYVHAGYLGAEPHTEVAPYQVSRLPEGGIIATGCRMFQPVASPAASGGYVVDYVYKVVRPLTTCLYKANPIHRDRFDIIYLFAQPVDEEHCIAHTLVIFLEDGIAPGDLRYFQQLIFLQDKPILENQCPRRLPIDEGMEVAIAADRSSVAYRRWLRDIGLRHGVTRREAVAA